MRNHYCWNCHINYVNEDGGTKCPVCERTPEKTLMNRILARLKILCGIKGKRHQQRMYKMCAELNLN